MFDKHGLVDKHGLLIKYKAGANITDQVVSTTNKQSLLKKVGWELR